jgi:hypothetical protein
MLERVHAAFVAAGFGEPIVRFSTTTMGIERVSSIERVLKRWPELERFVRVAGPAERQISVMSNLTDTGAWRRSISRS